jgi:hypothetical protein
MVLSFLLLMTSFDDGCDKRANDSAATVLVVLAGPVNGHTL